MKGFFQHRAFLQTPAAFLRSAPGLCGLCQSVKVLAVSFSIAWSVHSVPPLIKTADLPIQRPVLIQPLQTAEVHLGILMKLPDAGPGPAGHLSVSQRGNSEKPLIRF